MTDAIVVIALVLVAATAFGLYRRMTDGRMKDAPSAAKGDGRPVPMPDGSPEVGVDADEQHGVLTSDDLGVEPGGMGSRATLVQFSTAFCQPCRATRRVLDEVAGMVDGVAHVEIDAEANLDLVRALDIMRTPTVLVLDDLGRIRKRATGQPRKADVIAALGELA